MAVDYYLKGMQAQFENNPKNKALEKKIRDYMKDKKKVKKTTKSKTA